MDITNLIKTINNKGAVIGTCITETGRNPQIARIFANFGFDFLVIECEHSSYSFETVADLITIAKLSGVAPIVKIGEYSYHTFARYLDAGADGFILPRVRQKKEVQQVMEWINYILTV
jgi:2-keto-3-deoxy-L-rhamnonate aldolase RhmA